MFIDGFTKIPTRSDDELRIEIPKEKSLSVIIQPYQTIHFYHYIIHFFSILGKGFSDVGRNFPSSRLLW